MLVKAPNCSSSRLLHHLCLRLRCFISRTLLQEAHKRRVSVSSAINTSVPGAPLMFSYAQLASFIIWLDKPTINPDATAMTYTHTHTLLFLLHLCHNAFFFTFTNSYVVKTAESKNNNAGHSFYIVQPLWEFFLQRYKVELNKVEFLFFL